MEEAPQDSCASYTAGSEFGSEGDLGGNANPSTQPLASPTGASPKLQAPGNPRSEAGAWDDTTMQPRDFDRHVSVPSAEGGDGQAVGMIKSSFIKAEWQDSDEDLGRPGKLRDARSFLRKVQQSPVFDLVMGAVILFDTCVGVMDTDWNATHSEPSPRWTSISSTICFFVYALELSATFFVNSWKACGEPWVILDVVVVVSGGFDLVVQAVGSSLQGLGLVRAIRLLRILRLLRIFRKITLLKELKKLIKMMTACMKSLFWSFLFCFMVLTLWSMIAVELLYPTALELEDAGSWQCSATENCSENLSSVMRANLLFFKTVVAGDAWGEVAEPLILYSPWICSPVFIGAQITIVYGVLQLVVAVVVDEFAEQRENNVAEKAANMDEYMEKECAALTKIFGRIDWDCNGEVSLDELKDGAKRVPEFRDRLRVMDIDEADLEQFFSMLDEDESGAVSPDEFMHVFTRWITESRTASRFVKYNLMKTMAQTDKFQSSITRKLGRLERKMHLHFDGMGKSGSEPNEALASPLAASRDGAGSAGTELAFNEEPVTPKERAVPHKGRQVTLQAQQSPIREASNVSTESNVAHTTEPSVEHVRDLFLAGSGTRAFAGFEAALMRAEQALDRSVQAASLVAKDAMVADMLAAVQRAQEESVSALEEALRQSMEAAGDQSDGEKRETARIPGARPIQKLLKSPRGKSRQNGKSEVKRADSGQEVEAVASVIGSPRCMDTILGARSSDDSMTMFRC